MEPVPAAIDLSELIPPGATIAWGAGSAEPRSLTAALVQQRHQLERPRIYLGLSLTDTFQPEHADALEFVGMGGLGRNGPLHRAGRLGVIPSNHSTLVRAIASGEFPIDVAFAQVGSPTEDGRVSLGTTADYLVPALAAARVRVAEINDRVPRTHGDTLCELNRFDRIVHASYPLPELPPRPHGEVEQRLAANVAELVPDEAVIQTGIGGVLDAVTSALRDHRRLGIHTGLLTDGLAELIRCGAVDNAAKPADTGTTVATMVVGTTRLYDFVHENDAVALRAASYTHDAKVLGLFDTFVAINSALEVDLTGQVQAEIAGPNHVGAVGGLGDFARAGATASRGCSIIAMPSTAKGGSRSRIVPALSGGVTTLARSDADLVVTEYGVARLGMATLAERARRLVRVAHPRFRDELSRTAAALDR